MQQTIDDLCALTLSIEIRAAAAEDAYTYERARQERLWCEGQGWKSPLKASQYRTMNGMVDHYMARSKQADELTSAMRALREHNQKIARMKAGYPC